MTNKPPRPITAADLDAPDLELGRFPFPSLTDYASEGYRAATTDAVRHETAAAENVFNPTPYYSLRCAASTLTAVYKAHCSCEVIPSYDSLYFAMHDWRNLSYATDRGIVFG